MKKRTEKRMNNVQAYACVCVARSCSCTGSCNCYDGTAVTSASNATTKPVYNNQDMYNAYVGNSAAYASWNK